MAIIIEFIGLSGSGKSALACKAVQHLKANGLDVICRGNALLYRYFRKKPPEYSGIKWFILKLLFRCVPHFLGKHLVDTFYFFSLVNLVCRFEARNPELAVMVHKDIASNYHSDRGRQWALTMVYREFAVYQVVHELQGLIDADSVIVLDDGRDRIPRFVNALGDVESVDKTISYIEQFPLPDLVIHIDTEQSICRQRLATRRISGYSPLQLRPLSLQTRVETWENCQRCTVITYEMLKSKNIPVLKVSNNADLNTTVQLINECLDKFLDNK